MLDILVFLAPPFLACLTMVAIQGYLGLHVLRREIIFVDLALAQIAALGTLIAFFFHLEPGSAGSFAFSMGATTLGAAVFSWTRSRESEVPQEAIIGITYVIASAAAIVVADRAPEGAEHIKELLAGGVIWVTWPVVLRNAAVFAAVAVFHWVFRKRFIRISEDAEGAFRDGIRVRLWDFLFYLSFGLVIALSVEIAGVLMVFSFLVGPAIIAIAAARSWRGRLLVAWSLGAAATTLGLATSYAWDFPAGPAIVCSVGVLLLAHWAQRRIRHLTPGRPQSE